jgi:hypothetical protein
MNLLLLVLAQSTERLSEGVFYNLLKDFSLPLLAIIWAVYSYLRQSRRKLSIRQVGDTRLDKIIQINEHQVAYCVEMVITNDSPNASIVIAYYNLQLPWKEPGLEPLSDPMEAVIPCDLYEAPGIHIKLHRDQVLNHRRYQLGKLAPGDAFRGHFLAIGHNPIPSDLLSDERRTHIEASFIVQDTTRKEYKSKKPIELYF